VEAVVNVDLEVGGGEIVGLIGPNGAGKTSLIDAVSGFAKCRGEVLVDNVDVSRMPPHSRARRGLGRTWQAGELFDDLSVIENLTVAEQRRSSVWRTTTDLLRRRHRYMTPSEAGPILDRLGLRERADARPAQLSQGEQKLVGVGRALMGAPHIVLLDEPAAGLDSTETTQFSRVLRTIVSDGPGMLLVEHDMGLVLSVCDRIVVMDFGHVISRGTPNQVQQDPAVLSAYLGASHDIQSEDAIVL
jgi:branched-chain amino acid transport system ATP-binding protein